MLFRRIKLEKLQDSAQVQMARIENQGTRVRVPRDGNNDSGCQGTYENFLCSGITERYVPEARGGHLLNETVGNYDDSGS